MLWLSTLWCTWVAHGLGCGLTTLCFFMGRRNGWGPSRALQQQEDLLSYRENVSEDKFCSSRADRVLELKSILRTLTVKMPWSSKNVHWGNDQVAVSQEEIWKTVLVIFWRSKHGSTLKSSSKAEKRSAETNLTSTGLHQVHAGIPKTIFVHFYLHWDYFGF